MGGTRLDRLFRYVRVRAEDPPDRPYACLGCEQLFDVQYHVCPECGGYRVEVREDVRRRTIG